MLRSLRDSSSVYALNYINCVVWNATMVVITGFCGALLLMRVARARSAVHVPTGRLDSIACRKVYLPTSRILFQLTFSVCHTQNHYYYYYLCQSAIGHKRLAIPHTAQTASAQSANVNSNAERSVGWMGMALFQAAKKEPNCQIFANA